MIQKYSKIAFLLLASTVGTMSCSESYPGLEYVDDRGNGAGVQNEDTWTDLTPIMMFVNKQDFFTGVATRGSGPFSTDEESDGVKLVEDKLNNSEFYVFAFRNGRNIQGPNQELARLSSYRFASNASAYQPSARRDSFECLVDGSDYLRGLRTHINPNSSGELKPYEEDILTGGGYVVDNNEGYKLFYNQTNQEEPYNFFAYYIDDFKPSAQNTWRTDSAVYYQFKIDGTQDLMLGAAPPLNDSLRMADDYKTIWTGLKKDEQNRIMSNEGYSTYTAHRAIHPYIKMKHMLTQLRFEAYAADSTCNNIIIHGISIIGKNQTKMTVAHRDVSKIGCEFADTKDTLKLREAYDVDAKICPPLKEYSVAFNNDEALLKSPNYHWTMQEHKQVGGSLMLAPDSVYELRLSYTQKLFQNGEWKDFPRHTVYTLRAPSTPNSKIAGQDNKFQFNPGVAYKVWIAVYGLREIKIYVNMEGWINEEEPAIIDPDSMDNFSDWGF